jgi:hypothetical protein
MKNRIMIHELMNQNNVCLDKKLGLHIFQPMSLCRHLHYVPGEKRIIDEYSDKKMSANSISHHAGVYIMCAYMFWQL